MKEFKTLCVLGELGEIGEKSSVNAQILHYQKGFSPSSPSAPRTQPEKAKAFLIGDTAPSFPSPTGVSLDYPASLIAGE